MAITKIPSGSYRLRLYYPQDIQDMLGVKKLYTKNFKSKKEAKEAEINFYVKISELRTNQNKSSFELGGEVLFKNFYSETWLPAYQSGQTTTKSTPPTEVTIRNTMDIFRLHLNPMFGRYTLNYLNQNKEFVVRSMTAKATTYANIKAVKSYLNSIFDLAEEYDYIESNKLHKILRKVKATKKLRLKNERSEEDRFLSFEELQDWLIAVDEDYQNNLISDQTYLLFKLTLFLSDRKSESYALKWKNIDFENSQIRIDRALDKFGKEKSTKGHASTIFHISNDIKQLLQSWYKKQTNELSAIGLKQSSEQLLFTYADRSGNLNQPVHAEFLNYRMNSIEKRHKNLVHASPHKLRHTGATLARQSGASLEQVSEALTHSDTNITKTYINAPNVIQFPAGEIAINKLSQNVDGV